MSRQSLETATNGFHRNAYRGKIAKNHPLELDREKIHSFEQGQVEYFQVFPTFPPAINKT